MQSRMVVTTRDPSLRPGEPGTPTHPGPGSALYATPRRRSSTAGVVGTAGSAASESPTASASLLDMVIQGVREVEVSLEVRMDLLRDRLDKAEAKWSREFDSSRQTSEREDQPAEGNAAALAEVKLAEDELEKNAKNTLADLCQVLTKHRKEEQQKLQRATEESRVRLEAIMEGLTASQLAANIQELRAELAAEKEAVALAARTATVHGAESDGFQAVDELRQQLQEQRTSLELLKRELLEVRQERAPEPPSTLSTMSEALMEQVRKTLDEDVNARRDEFGIMMNRAFADLDVANSQVLADLDSSASRHLEAFSEFQDAIEMNMAHNEAFQRTLSELGSQVRGLTRCDLSPRRGADGKDGLPEEQPGQVWQEATAEIWQKRIEAQQLRAQEERERLQCFAADLEARLQAMTDSSLERLSAQISIPSKEEVKEQLDQVWGEQRKVVVEDVVQQVMEMLRSQKVQRQRQQGQQDPLCSAGTGLRLLFSRQSEGRGGAARVARDEGQKLLGS